MLPEYTLKGFFPSFITKVQTRFWLSCHVIAQSADVTKDFKNMSRNTAAVVAESMTCPAECAWLELYATKQKPPLLHWNAVSAAKWSRLCLPSCVQHATYKAHASLCWDTCCIVCASLFWECVCSEVSSCQVGPRLCTGTTNILLGQHSNSKLLSFFANDIDFKPPWLMHKEAVNSSMVHLDGHGLKVYNRLTMVLCYVC